MSKVMELFTKAMDYEHRDPEAALWMARKTAEAVCRAVFIRDVSPNCDSKKTLETFIQQLGTRNSIPKHMLIPIRTIQAYGNYGTHDQGDDQPYITSDYVKPCLQSLTTLIEWFQNEEFKAAQDSYDREIEDKLSGNSEIPRMKASTEPPDLEPISGKVAEENTAFEEALKRMLPDEKAAWEMANGVSQEGIPMTPDEIAQQLKCLPEDVHDLLVSAGAKIRRFIHGPAADTAASLVGRHIFVVEDSPRDLKRLTFVLGTKLGMQLSIARSGEEAIEKIIGLRQSPDRPLMILDMHLPFEKQTDKLDPASDQSGRWFDPSIGEMLLLEAVADFPIIVFSSLLRISRASSICTREKIEGLRRRWGKFGAFRCVEKPDMEALVESIISVISLSNAAGNARTEMEQFEFQTSGGGVTIDVQAGVITWNGELLRLNPLERQMLKVLAENARKRVAVPYSHLQGLIIENSDRAPAGSLRERLKADAEALAAVVEPTGLKLEDVPDIGYQMILQ